MDNLTTYFDQFQQALSLLQSHLSPLIEKMAIPCRILGAIGALICLSHKVWRDWADAAPIDWFGLLRPFVLLLCISFFPLVMTFINGILNPVAQASSNLYVAKVKENQQLKLNIHRLKEKNLQQSFADIFLQEGDRKNVSSDVWNVVRNLGNNLSYAIQKAFLSGIQLLIDLVANVAGFFISFARTGCLMILSVFGPLAFAFACWPGFEGGLMFWLSKYVSISLWLPVLHIINYMVEELDSIVFKSWNTSFSTGTMTSATGNIDQDFYLVLILKIISVFSYFCVPTIASWIIQSTGAGAVTRKMAGGLSMAGKQATPHAIKAAKSIAGGVALGASTAGVAAAAQAAKNIAKKSITPK